MSFNLVMGKTLFYGLKLHFKNIPFPIVLSLGSAIAFGYSTLVIYSRMSFRFDYYTLVGLLYLAIFSVAIFIHTSLFSVFFSSKQGLSLKAFFADPLQIYSVYLCKYIYVFVGLFVSLVVVHLKLQIAWYNNLLLSLILLFFVVLLSFAVLLFLTRIKSISWVIVSCLFVALLLPKNLYFYLNLIGKASVWFHQNNMAVIPLVLATETIFTLRFRDMFYQIEPIKNVINVSLKPNVVFNWLFKYFNNRKAFIAKDLILIVRKPAYMLIFLVSVLLSFYISEESTMVLMYIVFISYLLSAYTMELFDLEMKKKNLLRLFPMNDVPLLKYKFITGTIVNILLNAIILIISHTLNSNIGLTAIVSSVLAPSVFQFAGVTFYQLYPEKIHLTTLLLTSFVMLSLISLNKLIFAGQILILILISIKGKHKIRKVMFN